MIRAILIHGNDGGKPTDNWFPYLKLELEKLGVKVDAPQFPDADLARASYWIPYLKNVLKADSKTILIGHSSGAIAAMRYAEENQILGSVLVGTYHTDLGINTEKLSGYFDSQWNWNAIKKNQQWIIQFAGLNDPWIPIEEARFVQDKLSTDYYESKDQGHFGGDYYKETFPELLQAIKSKLEKSKNLQIAKTFAKRLWDIKDLKAIQDFFDPKCILHSSLGEFSGVDSMEKIAQAWLKGFPDLFVENIAIISEKDLVVIHWKAKGTHLGEFKGIAPTKKPISYSGVTIYRIEHQKIVEYWAYLDMYHLLNSLR